MAKSNIVHIVMANTLNVVHKYYYFIHYWVVHQNANILQLNTHIIPLSVVLVFITKMTITLEPELTGVNVFHPRMEVTCCCSTPSSLLTRRKHKCSFDTAVIYICEKVLWIYPPGTFESVKSERNASINSFSKSAWNRPVQFPLFNFASLW